ATIGLPPTGDRPRSIGLISAQAGMAFRDWAGLASTPVCSMTASHRELSGLGPYRKGGRSEVNTKPPTRLHSKVLPSTRQRRTARDGNMADVRVTCTTGVHRRRVGRFNAKTGRFEWPWMSTGESPTR